MGVPSLSFPLLLQQKAFLWWRSRARVEFPHTPSHSLSGFSSFFFIEMQTSSSFELLQDPGTKITEKRPFFISCFAWASAAWLAIKSSLFQKAWLQFVASVAELESHLLFLANAQLSTGFRGESFSSAGVPEGSQAPRRRAPLWLTLWNQYTDSIGRRKRKN